MDALYWHMNEREHYYDDRTHSMSQVADISYDE